MAPPPLLRLVLRAALVWLLMTVILVIVPDSLEGWTGLQVARVIGWVVACTVWFLAIENVWRVRLGPFARETLRFALWVSAALVAIWFSDLFRP